MPGKPSRRDRKRRGAEPERRPRPAPPIAPGRVVRAARVGAPTATREDSSPATVQPEAAAPEQATAVTQRGPRPRATGVGALRRGATSSARAMEIQREERIRRDSVKDLRSIAVAAAITVVALVAATTLL